MIILLQQWSVGLIYILSRIFQLLKNVKYLVVGVFFFFWGAVGVFFICLGFFLCSPTLSAVARSYYLFPFTHCNVPARSVPEFTAPGSAAPRDIVVLALVGSSCLDQYHGQRSPHQLLQDEFSKSASAPRNTDPSEWKRGWV